MWRHRIFLTSGCLAAILLSFTAVRSAIGLSTSEKPSPAGHYEIPPFADLLHCDAHFSYEILRIKNAMPAQNGADELQLMHRNYRRLHRLMRQVGRRDGISPTEQTDRLRRRVHQFSLEKNPATAADRNRKCRVMAEMPIVRNRYSQRIVGQ